MSITGRELDFALKDNLLQCYSARVLPNGDCQGEACSHDTADFCLSSFVPSFSESTLSEQNCFKSHSQMTNNLASPWHTFCQAEQSGFSTVIDLRAQICPGGYACSVAISI